MPLIRFFTVAFLIHPLLAQAQYSQRYDHGLGKKISIDNEVLAHCLIREAEKYPNAKSSAGIPMGKLYKKSTFPSRRSSCHMNRGQLFDYLSAFPSRFCDFGSGKESSLRDWIMKQKEASIDPVSLFSKSLELNGGNVFDSILTIHQLLRNEARYHESKHYSYVSSPTIEKFFWNKFVDLRGDLEEHGGKADHQGTWYRIWGIALYRLSMTEKNIPDEHPNCNSTYSNGPQRAWANLKSLMVAVSAEIAKPLMKIPENDPSGKIRINVLGADLGAYFSSWRSIPDLPLRVKENDPVCQNRGYLRSEHP